MVDVVAGTVATNYDTATSHTITVRETLAGALNSPRDTVLTIDVTDAGGAALGPFTLAWTSAASELTNLSFSITPAPLVGDVVTLSLDGNSDMSSPFDTSDANTIDSGEAASGSLTFTGIATPLSAGLTYARVNVVRGASNVNSSIASITLTAPSDTTAPFLTAPTGTKTGSTTATLTVTTDEANGILYMSASAAVPSKAQIKAGQNSTGAASNYAYNQGVIATGVQTRNATGLTAATTYTMHYMHEDVAGNQSNIASASSFTTDAAGGVGTTWDPAFKHASHTLTNGNKTVTATTTGDRTIRTVHATPALGSKVYWEIKVETMAADAMWEAFVGLCDSALTNSNYIGAVGHGCGMAPDGGLVSLTPGSGFTYVAGDVLQFASDNSAGSATLKIAKNGGAYTTFTGDGAMAITNIYPAVQTTLVGDSFTIRASASDWTYSPPSGYVAMPTA